MIARQVFSLATRGRGSYPITDRIDSVVQEAGIGTGICHVFLQHTSASLMLCENADPDVRDDLERFMSRHVPDGDPLFVHVDEGPDDMSAHVRTVLTHSDLTLPVRDARLALGTWQGVYLWEHRHAGQRRRVMITVIGE
jgi:secondary thiamine-phosphate synthase enzyme